MNFGVCECFQLSGVRAECGHLEHCTQRSCLFPAPLSGCRVFTGTVHKPFSGLQTAPPERCAGITPVWLCCPRPSPLATVASWLLLRPSAFRPCWCPEGSLCRPPHGNLPHFLRASAQVLPKHGGPPRPPDSHSPAGPSPASPALFCPGTLLTPVVMCFSADCPSPPLLDGECQDGQDSVFPPAQFPST